MPGDSHHLDMGIKHSFQDEYGPAFLRDIKARIITTDCFLEQETERGSQKIRIRTIQL
jgi:hypothetical protein